MKKIFGFLMIIFSVFFLVGCKNDDAEKVQDAYDRLIHPASNPSGVTNDMTVPTLGVHSVKIAWASDTPATAAIQEGTAANTAIIKITRPADDAENVNVKVTATLTLNKEELEKEFEFTVLKLPAAEAKTITEVRDPSIAVGTNVRINNVVVVDANKNGYVIADASNATLFVYGFPHGRTIGEKGYVIGAKDASYDAPQMRTTASATVGATTFMAQDHDFNHVAVEKQLSYFNLFTDLIENFTTAPVKVADYADKLKAKKVDPTLSEVVKVRGFLVLAVGKGGKWSTDTDESRQLYLADSKTDPQNLVRIHYSSSKEYDELKALDGAEVVLTCVQYTIRDDYETLAIVSKTLPVWYVWAIDYELAGELTDLQKLNLDKAALSVPTVVEENKTITLPTSGANGSAISWTSSHPAIITTAGVVTVPDGNGVEVTLTASLTLGSATGSQVFKVNVGNMAITSLADTLDLADGATDVSEGKVVWLASNKKSAIIGDETGYAYVYNSTEMEITVGETYRFAYEIDIYNGLVELTKVTITAPQKPAPTLPELVAEEWDAADAVAFNALTAWAPVYVELELFGYADGTYTNGLLDGYDGYIQTNGAPAACRDKIFTIKAWVTGRASGGRITLGTAVAADYVVTEIAPNPLTGVEIATPGSTTLKVGDPDLQLSATKVPRNSVGTILWKSSDESKATVDATGKVTAKAAGPVTITAYVGTIEDTIDLTIQAGVQYTLVYETGFEGDDFAAGTTYNNDTANVVGPAANQWSILHGTPTTTASAVIDGAKSVQMRAYAPNTSKPDESHHGHELSARTLFTFAKVDQITFKLLGNAAAVTAEAVVVVSTSTDGTTWVEVGKQNVSATAADVIIDLETTLENVYVQIKVVKVESDAYVNLAVAAQVSIDNFIVKKVAE